MQLSANARLLLLQGFPASQATPRASKTSKLTRQGYQNGPQREPRAPQNERRTSQMTAYSTQGSRGPTSSKTAKSSPWDKCLTSHRTMRAPRRGREWSYGHRNGEYAGHHHMSDLRQDCAGVGKGQRRAIWIQEGARCWLPSVAKSQHSEDKGLVAKRGWKGFGELASKQVRTTRKYKMCIQTQNRNQTQKDIRNNKVAHHVDKTMCLISG